MKKGLFNKITGHCGEDYAAEYLKKRGYKEITRNFNTKFGEIDIIATKKDDLVFVEVKTRSSDLYGTPAEAVTYHKKQKIVNTARYYLSQSPTDKNIRFDVIEIFGGFDGNKFVLMGINHLKNVFEEV